MSDAMSMEDVKKHVRVYITVFAALAVLTVVTVAISYLDFSIPMAIFVAMVIATFKASLVAAYFMHLISEKKLIYSVLILTAVFFVVLIVILLSFYSDNEGGRIVT